MPGSTPKPRRKSASPAARPRGATGPALTHFDAGGRAHMVDVGDKDVTHRVARARGSISMSPATFERIREGGVAKGDVLGIARIAAIGAAKRTSDRTSDLIPLCHPLPLTRVAVDFALDEAGVAVRIEVVAETRARTGVEMEALTAAAVGLLTVYDMCKAADRGMRIGALELVEKSGGKSGPWRADRT